MVSLVSTVLVLSIFQVTSSLKSESFGEKRERILTEMDASIEQAKREGNYNCCIQPSCRMCFLGHWIWDGGSCDCDNMILSGKVDEVCPECRKGMGDEECSSIKETCEV
ncbi:MAG: hypothetical protein GF368_05470 [Candidatus Aenigmarchaeota archaeon]|nr:hypothetical protein [Candidatus Aenigmarchaeota archaeon]